MPATSQLVGYISSREQRYGSAPPKLWISRRTVSNLAAEFLTRYRLIESSRVNEWVEAAMRGNAEFCGIPIEVID